MSVVGDIAWPLLIGGSLYYFRDDIKAAFARIKAVGPLGVTLESAPSTQQPVAAEPLVGKADDVISSIKQQISSEQLDPAVKSVRDDLANRHLKKDDEIDLLAHALAASNIQLHHERTYRAIFGSQMSALVMMNNPAGAPEETIKAIYDAAAVQHPDLYKDFTFERWIAFLVHGGLATRADKQYQTTPYGRGFLKYVVDMRLVTPKPY